MSAYLQIRAGFVTGRYHGWEWPPAPMHLFQALVSGAAADHVQNGYLSDGVVQLFQWLEQQEPPMIFAPAPQQHSLHVISVPDNDDDRAMEAWASGKKRPWEIESDRKNRYSMKPTRRRLIEGQIVYVWAIAEADRAVATKVAELAEYLYCLGRGIDAAWAAGSINDSLADQLLPCWRPSDVVTTESEPLQVPVAGSMDSLIERQRARYSRLESREFVNKRPVCREIHYSHGFMGQGRPYRLYDIKTLDGQRPYAWRHENLITLAAMVRNALDKIHRKGDSTLRGFSLGHVSGSTDLSCRLSWLPLASVGHAQVDGRIRRVMILGPRGCDQERMREAVFGMRFTQLHQDGKPIILMVETDEIANAVMPYLETSEAWRTVTPMILPGQTSRGKRQPGKLVPQKVCALILKALEREGYPEVTDMSYQKAPFHPASLGASEYRVASYMQHPRFHVRVRFTRPIRGPVLAGVGRHYGLGLFVP